MYELFAIVIFANRVAKNKNEISKEQPNIVYLQLGHLLFLRLTLAAIRAIYSEPQEEQMNHACFWELALKS